jgi:hypothetical protein
VNGYYHDLKILFRYLKRRRHCVSNDIPFNEIDITDIDLDFIKQIRIEELYRFQSFSPGGTNSLSAASRCRRTSTVKSFFNYLTLKSEMGHPNSEFPEDLGEVYSNISFCIMSTLTPSDSSDSMFYTAPHPICYQILCSSFSLTIKINNDYVVCPREGGKVKLNGYVGFIICPDYNLICTGTQVCNDIIDCIEKKSLFKENTFNYDYIPVTTQSYSKILLMTIVEAYELGDDGFCPKY